MTGTGRGAIRRDGGGLEGPLWRRALARWRQAARAVGVVQTRFLMLVIFVLVVLPTGLVMRLVRDPLRLRRPQGSTWTPHPTEPPNLDDARRQF